MAGSRVKDWLTRFLRNDAGNMVVAFAFMAPVALGAAGLAIDTSAFNMKRAGLQAAADAAAMAGAKELAVASATPESIAASATAFARQSLDAGLDINVAVTSNKKDSKVSVTITENWTPFLGQYIGTAMTPIVTTATAGLAGATNVCVLALDATASGAVRITNNARMVAPACAVYADSTASNAVVVDTGASVEADLVCSAGGAAVAPGSVDPEPTTDCAKLDDPLKGRPYPTYSGCSHTNKRVGAGLVTLQPGVYCGGLEIVGPAAVTFAPGEYIIKDGPFLISGLSYARGKNIGFFLTGNNAVINFTGGATVEMSGRESGSMAGLLFFEDRAASPGRTHHINTLLTRELTGTIYLPKGNLKIDPQATVGDRSAYTAIVANQLELRDGPELILNTNYGATSVPVPKGIRSAATAVLEK